MQRSDTQINIKFLIKKYFLSQRFSHSDFLLFPPKLPQRTNPEKESNLFAPKFAKPNAARTYYSSSLQSQRAYHLRLDALLPESDCMPRFVPPPSVLELKRRWLCSCINGNRRRRRRRGTK